MRKILLVAALLMMGLTAFAQKQYNYKGHVIDDRGNLYARGMKLGFITKDSIVKNNKGKVLAFVKPGGVLEDAEGNTLGRMGKDGRTYYNANGQHVFTVKENTDTETCNILDANGKVIGNVHNNYKQMACVIHCSIHKMDMKTHKKIQ